MHIHGAAYRAPHFLGPPLSLLRRPPCPQTLCAGSGTARRTCSVHGGSACRSPAPPGSSSLGRPPARAETWSPAPSFPYNGTIRYLLSFRNQLCFKGCIQIIKIHVQSENSCVIQI